MSINVIFHNIFWRIGSKPMLYFKNEMPKNMDIIGETCLQSQSIGSDNPCILYVTLNVDEKSYIEFEIQNLNKTPITCDDVINTINDYCVSRVPFLVRSEIYSIGYSEGIIELDLFKRDTQRMNSPENC